MKQIPTNDGTSIDQKSGPVTGDKGSLDQDEVIHFLPIVNLFLINRRYILLPAAFLAFGVWVLTLLMSPVYTAAASFMISGSSPAATGNSPAGGGAGADIDELTGMPEYWSALLHSSEFLSKVVKPQLAADASTRSVNWLRDLAGNSDDDEVLIWRAVNQLKGMVSIKPEAKSKRVIMVLSVTSEAPDLSENIAVSLIQAIAGHGGDERNQKAIENRDFIQQRLQLAEQELSKAETALSAFLTRNRKTNLPRLEVEKERMERTVSVQEEIYVTLRKQLEMAKLKVQENTSVLQILEQPAAQRTGPKRLRIVMVAFGVGLLLFAGRIFARDRLAKMDRNDPDVHLFLDQIHGIESDFVRWWNALYGFVKQGQGWLLRRFGR